MRTIKLVGKGFSDTLEHLLPFTVWTVLWWVCLLPIVTAPGATAALFAVTDPRQATNQPDFRLLFHETRRFIGKGWLLAALPLAVGLLLSWNLWFYVGRDSRFGILVPVWLVFLALTAGVGLSAFAVAALTETPIGDALRTGVALTLSAPFRWLFVAALGYLVLAVGTVLVIPLVMFIPALIAAIVNRLVLDGLGLPVFDPLTPTDERRREETSGKERRSRFGP